MKTKIAAVALAALTLAGTFAPCPPPRPKRAGAAVASASRIAAGLIAGAATLPRVPPTPSRSTSKVVSAAAPLVREYDAWGNYFRTVRVCKVFDLNPQGFPKRGRRCPPPSHPRAD